MESSEQNNNNALQSATVPEIKEKPVKFCFSIYEADNTKPIQKPQEIFASSSKRNRRKKMDNDFLTFSNDDESIALDSGTDNSCIHYEKTQEGNYICTYPECDKQFPEKMLMKKHIASHSERLFACPYDDCGKKFPDNAKLKRHLLVHTGEKNFRCEFCRKYFSLDFNLRTHLRLHTGEKPYHCSYPGCFKSFTQSGNLAAHEKSHYVDRDKSSDQVALQNIIICQREQRQENTLGDKSNFRYTLLSECPPRGIITKKKQNSKDFSLCGIIVPGLP